MSLLSWLAPDMTAGALPQVSLVKNINRTIPPLAGLRQASFTSAGAVTYFTARNGNDQQELWKTDGTQAGTVQVWDAAARVFNNVTLDRMTAVGDKLFFSFEDAAHGRELWVTDGSGTPGSTYLVADLVAGPGSSYPKRLTPFNNGLMFIAQGTLQKRGLWFTDGTEPGTRLLMDLSDDDDLDYPETGPWAESNGLFYFEVCVGEKQFFYRTDGTAAGTLLLKELPAASRREGFVKAGNVVLFRAAAKAGNDELWKTDGTVKGTTLLKEIRAGAKGGGPRTFSPVGNLVYFIANQNDTASAVWRTDGTAAGTKQVTARWGISVARFVPVGNYLLTETFEPSFFGDENHGRGGVRSLSLTTGKWESLFEPEPDLGGTYAIAQVGGQAFFVSADSMEQETLWVTDGTKAGTRKIDAAAVPRGHKFGPYLGVAGDRILFPGFTSGAGKQLWVSDGTEAGTQPLSDGGGQDAGSNPSSLMTAGGVLYFSANDGMHGSELWKSDGTEAGTVMVKDIWTGQGTSVPNSSNPVMLAEMNGVVYFSANDGTSGVELWRTDGTGAGTTRVKDIRPGLSDGLPKNAVVFDGKLFFVGNSAYSGQELWVTDGTEAGTSLYTDLTSGNGGIFFGLSWLTAAGDALYFVASGPGVDRGLWRMPSGGMPVRVGSIQQIRSLIARPPTPGALYKPGQWLVYAGTQTSLACELWVLDGTQEGTQKIGSFPFASSYEVLNSFQLLPDGDVIFLFGRLYRISGDGYARLTYNPPYGPSPSAILTAGSRLYYTLQVGSNDSGPGYQLWTVDMDSADAPTKLYQGRPGELISLLKTVQGNVFFLSSAASQRYTVWTSGGTVASTREIMPPEVSLSFNSNWSAAASDSHLFLTATTLSTGPELHSFSLEGQLAVTEVTGDQTHSLPAGGTLDLGPQTVGQSVSRMLRLENLGVSSLTGLTLAFGGSGSVADYGITQTSIPKLAAGLAVEVQITFTPQQSGMRPSAFEVRQGWELLYLVNLTGSGLAADAAPVITQFPASRIVRVGADVVFSADAVSAQELTLDWRRDGDATVGTQNTLALTNVQPADAGNYALTFINNTDSVTTPPAALALVLPAVPEVTVAEHFPLNLSCTVLAPAGCTLAYQWTVDGHALTDDGRIQGSRSATLTIADHSSAIAAETYGNYKGVYECLVTLVSSDHQETLSHGITQVSVLPVPTIYFYPPTILLGEAVDIQIGTDVPATRFSAKGLPPGLTLNPATGRITGAPTKVLPINKATGEYGAYPVVCSAGNDSGDGPSKTLNFRVVPAIPAGAYDGLLGRSDWIDGSLGGRVTVTSTTTGAQSGKLLYEGKSYALAKPAIIQELTHGDLGDAVIEFTVSRGKTLPALKLRMTTDWSSSNVTLTDGEPGHQATGWVRNQTQRQDRASFAGRYNWALRTQDGTLESDLRIPRGAGYLMATVSKTATVTWKGKMADGTAVTGSGLLTEHPSIRLSFPVHQDLYSLKGAVHGWLDLEDPLLPTPEITLDWFKAALPATSKERRYKDGIPLHTLYVTGGRYVAPGRGEMLFGEPGYEVTTGVSLLGPHLLMEDYYHYFSLTTKNTAVLAPVKPDSPVRSLSFNVAQGTFKGSFTLIDYNSTNPPRPWTRVVPFEGVILGSRIEMYGHFLLPELPQAGPPATTQTTSPMHSGRVEINY